MKHPLHVEKQIKDLAVVYKNITSVQNPISNDNSNQNKHVFNTET